MGPDGGGLRLRHRPEYCVTVLVRPRSLPEQTMTVDVENLEPPSTKVTPAGSIGEPGLMGGCGVIWPAGSVRILADGLVTRGICTGPACIGLETTVVCIAPTFALGGLETAGL